MGFENVTVPVGTRVVVLMGGDSAEREVSLHTGAQVAEALSSQGIKVTTIDTSESDFITLIQDASPDAVFVCLHGRDGEDGTMQGLLELLDIPYVGSGVLASALAMDKVMSKHFFAHSDIPTPDYVALRRGKPYDVAEITESLGTKTVAKPANEGSAIGVTISHTPEELPAAIEAAFAHDDLVLVEAFVAGVEVTVGVLGNDEVVALPTIEIIAEHEFYDYESKYVIGMSEHIIPARIPQPLIQECETLAIRAHEVLGCRGMSRSDMIVTADGEVELLEINTIPGMTSTSLLPDAARAGGLEFPRLCEVLVGLALEG